MIASKPYDLSLTILNTSMADYRLKINRNIVPDIIELQDWFMIEHQDNT